jgi:uncharacterized protein
MKPRYLFDQTLVDLERKMVFIGGPRQVGKTTLARQVLGHFKAKTGYLNWDVPEDREKILERQLPLGKIWVFDEIHKYRRWRDYLKGVYDAVKVSAPMARKILVTGSARLDYYRFGGDSLQGRYHYLRLHPLSSAELKISSPADFQELLKLGGFPEPYFSSSEKEARRWSREYRTRLIREDLVALERVEDLGSVELLAMRLPALVGSPLSINALREDLQVSHASVKSWLNILERLYSIFRLSPFGAPKIRAVKKEQKHYHFDWSLVPEDALRFENLVASHLLKWVHYQQDVEGRDLDLLYFRDVDGREVDFVVTENGRPIQFVECKWADAEIGKGLRYLKQRFPDCEAFQISATGKKDYATPEGIRVTSAIRFLKGLV